MTMQTLTWSDVRGRIDGATAAMANTLTRNATAARTRAAGTWGRLKEVEAKIPGGVLILAGLGLTVATDGIASGAGARLALAGVARVMIGRGTVRSAEQGGALDRAMGAVGVLATGKADTALAGAAAAVRARRAAPAATR